MRKRKPETPESSVWRHADAPVPSRAERPRRDGPESPWPAAPARSARVGGVPRRGVAAAAPVEPPAAPEPVAHDRREQRRRELRIHGRAACLAVASDRFDAIRKVWFNRARSRELGTLLSRLAAARIGYREVDDAELELLTESAHHEGLCFEILRAQQPDFPGFLRQLRQDPQPRALLLLEGVGNPHNLGAILRSAVHFDAAAVLLAPGSAGLSGAAYRVAEGAAERVPLVAIERWDQLDALQAAGYVAIGTAADGADRLYDGELPQRALLMFGAEGSGLSSDARRRARQLLAIPGSGRVDSLNVGQAVVAVLGEYWRQWVAG